MVLRALDPVPALRRSPAVRKTVGRALPDTGLPGEVGMASFARSLAAVVERSPTTLSGSRELGPARMSGNGGFQYSARWFTRVDVALLIALLLL